MAQMTAALTVIRGQGACGKQLYADALALLKAQEPRVMTLEEVKSAWRNRNIAFLVEYNDGGNPVWMQLRERLRGIIRRLVCRICKHEFDCCPRITKRCAKCVKALEGVVKWK